MCFKITPLGAGVDESELKESAVLEAGLVGV